MDCARRVHRVEGSAQLGGNTGEIVGADEAAPHPEPQAAAAAELERNQAMPRLHVEQRDDKWAAHPRERARLVEKSRLQHARARAGCDHRPGFGIEQPLDRDRTLPGALAFAAVQDHSLPTAAPVVLNRVSPSGSFVQSGPCASVQIAGVM